MSTKKVIRLFYIIPLVNLITLLVFLYRYIWFGIETVPFGRCFAIGMFTCISCAVFLNEAND